ncbi:MAG: tetratricopeptide repeat protein, partial [Candidatus Polarisedimenticolia bacterium]
RQAALMARGRSALAAGDHAAAREALEKAVAMAPGDAVARHLLGRAYAGEKKYQPAARELNESLRLAPGNPEVLVDLAAIEENSGRLDRAAGYYRQALAAGPQPRAERGLASLLAKQGHLDESIASLRRLAIASPGDAETRYQLGMALMQAGDCKAAIPEFDAALAARPGHLATMMNRGNCLQRVGRHEEAEKTLAAFREASESEARVTERRRNGWFLLQEADRKLTAGDARGAMAALDEAIKLDPDSAGARAMKGQILEAMGDDRGAAASFKKAAELDSSDPMILVEAGRLLGKIGRVDEAIPLLRLAAQVDPLMPEPHLFLAAAYRQLGRTAEASAEEEAYRRLAGKGAPGPR